MNSENAEIYEILAMKKREVSSFDFMLLEHLYLISLERPEHLGMFMGLPINSMKLQDAQIDILRSYITGLTEANRLAKINTGEIDDFFYWLRDVKQEFPTQGWEKKYFDDCNGNHLLAIEKFWSFLHEFLLLKKPDWFVKLNRKPIPSKLRNGAGTPNKIDIRRSDHKEIV